MSEELSAATRVVEVALPNGAFALVRVADVDGGGAEKVSWPDRFDLDGVAETLEGVAQALRSRLDSAKPSRVSVEMGVELAVKSGRLTGLLVEGSGKGSLTVTLEWSSPGFVAAGPTGDAGTLAGGQDSSRVEPPEDRDDVRPG